MRNVAKIFLLAGAGVGWIAGILYLCSIPDFPWIFANISLVFGAIAGIFAFTDWFFDWTLSNKKESTQVAAYTEWAVLKGVCPYCENVELIPVADKKCCPECERVFPI